MKRSQLFLLNLKNIMPMLLLAVAVCIFTNKSYATGSPVALLNDSTLTKWAKGKISGTPFSYQDYQPYLPNTWSGLGGQLAVNVALLTPTGFEGYRPYPLSRPEFVFIRFPIFNKPVGNNNK